jgi:uncharacterized protein YjiS (DUF1127 family)
MTTRSPRLASFLGRAAQRAGMPLRRLARRWRAWRQNARDLAQIELLDPQALRDLGAGFSTRHGVAATRCASDARR